jgi:hypothetical protein
MQGNIIIIDSYIRNKVWMCNVMKCWDSMGCVTSESMLIAGRVKDFLLCHPVWFWGPSKVPRILSLVVERPCVKLIVHFQLMPKTNKLRAL